jgi:hypothetical protein
MKRPDPRAANAFLPHHFEKGTNVSLCTFSEFFQWIRPQIFLSITVSYPESGFPASPFYYIYSKSWGAGSANSPETISRSSAPFPVFKTASGLFIG